MKVRVWILLMVLFSSAIQAEDKCEHAVDQADSLNVNLKECDGEKSGLNAVIHNYFNKQAQDSSSSIPSKDVSGVDVEVQPEERREMFSEVIANAQDLSNERFQLILSVFESCPNGVRVSDELVIPAKGGFKIKLVFDCL